MDKKTRMYFISNLKRICLMNPKSNVFSGSNSSSRLAACLHHKA